MKYLAAIAGMAFVLTIDGFAQSLHTEQPYSVFAFSDSVDLRGSTTHVFEAVTGDISGWWDHSFSHKPYRLFIEPKPGGGFWEMFDDKGNGVLHATVTYADRGKVLRFVGPLGLAGKALDMVSTYTLKSITADSTRLYLDVHAAGEITPGLEKVVHGVWVHFLVERLKPYLAHQQR